MAIKLSNWQTECSDLFSNDHLDKKNFVVYAGTGAGKTIAASQCVYDHLLRNPEELGVIAAPYRAIKSGWAAILRLYGLEVATKPSEIAADTSVIVTTYGGAYGILNYIKNEFPVRKFMFVFDEFHHLEETNTWAGIFIDFDEKRVSRRILLSGTPWRESGNLPASWVQYDDNDEIIAHVRHTYGQNVNADDEQRNTVPVNFRPTRVHGVQRILNDDGTFIDERYDSDETCRSDSISKFVRFSSLDEFRECHGLCDLLHDAIECLDRLRLQSPLVGGIAFVSSKEAGEAVQLYLEEQGKRAVLVTSDDPLAHKRLAEFRDNPMAEWIIAIDMVSEGVDIPRLRVVADFTNRMTLLHIIQRWGRVLRRLRDKNGKPIPNDCDAYVFFVGHAQLLYVAEKIEEDVRREKREKNNGEGGQLPSPPRQTMTLSHNGERKHGIFKGLILEDQIERVADWILATDFNNVRTQRLGLAGAVNLAQFLVKTNTVPGSFFSAREDFDIPTEPAPQPATKDDVVSEYSRIANVIVMRGFDGDAAAAMTAINREHGVKSWSRANKTMAQLEERRDACKRLHYKLFGGVQ